jgi:hypothetical protein
MLLSIPVLEALICISEHCFFKYPITKIVEAGKDNNIKLSAFVIAIRINNLIHFYLFVSLAATQQYYIFTNYKSYIYIEKITQEKKIVLRSHIRCKSKSSSVSILALVVIILM